MNQSDSFIRSVGGVDGRGRMVLLLEPLHSTPLHSTPSPLRPPQSEVVDQVMIESPEVSTTRKETAEMLEVRPHTPHQTRGPICWERCLIPPQYSSFRSSSLIHTLHTAPKYSTGTVESHVPIAIGIHVRLCGSNTLNVVSGSLCSVQTGLETVKQLYSMCACSLCRHCTKQQMF